MKKNTADDVWHEIFLRLPLDSIFRSKSVNKVWLSTLSSPNFINQWYELNCASLPWALAQYAIPKDSGDDNDRLTRNFAITCPDSHSQFIENHQNGFSFRFLDPLFQNSDDGKNIHLISSSSGLVLCGIQRNYCVCNPLTQKWVSLPPPPTMYSNVAGLLCDGCTSFKVVIPEFEDAEFKVAIFSSELGEWNVYDVPCPPDVALLFSDYDNFVTRNGVFYWFQKKNRRILAVCVSGNNNNGTCCSECRLIDIPYRAEDGHLESLDCLGDSEGSICYAMVNEKEKTLSAWVLEEDWCLMYKDKKLHDMFAGMESVLKDDDEIGKIDYTQVRILGFNPSDKNVVILGYYEYIWAYNTRTKGYEQLFDLYFLRTQGLARVMFLTFALKPWPTVLPPVSW